MKGRDDRSPSAMRPQLSQYLTKCYNNILKEGWCRVRLKTIGVGEVASN